MRHLRYVLVALAIGAVAAGPLPSAAAQTAPSYQSSDPSKDEMMDHPPAEVTVTFDQPLDESSAMNVFDECGNEIDAGPATVDLNELTVGIGGKTPSGTWEVVYKAVGVAGATGSRGSTFEFMVHHGKPCDGGKKKHHHGGDKKKNRHGGHDRHREDDGGRDHGGHDETPPGGHSGHSGMPMSGSTSHSGHDATGTSSNTGGHGKHGPAKHGSGRHGTSHMPGETDPPPFATDGNVPVGADGEAVLLGLGLALAVGVLGGWLLRLSSNLAGV